MPAKRICFLFCITTLVCLGAAGPRVLISGGADDSGHVYEWTVSNHDRSAIVSVAIPHYHASFFVAPKGWKTDESSGLVNVDGPGGPGLCVARAPSIDRGIGPDESATFSLQVTHAGAQRGPGTVRIRFADGRETTIAGVEVPQAGTIGDKYLSLIGLGTIFAVMIGWRAFRGRTRPSTDPHGQ